MVGLIGLLAVTATVALLVTGRYPEQLYGFALGLNRWVLWVAGYAGLMTDRYPPFRLDISDPDPGYPDPAADDGPGRWLTRRAGLRPPGPPERVRQEADRRRTVSSVPWISCLRRPCRSFRCLRAGYPVSALKYLKLELEPPMTAMTEGPA